MDRSRPAPLRLAPDGPRRPRNTAGLVLTLGLGVDDWCMIDDRVRVAVDSVQGRKARVRINAPREVTILRKALYESARANPNGPPGVRQAGPSGGTPDAPGLVLSVAVGADDWVMIGDRVRLAVDSVQGRKARVRINAPEAIRIFRKALYESAAAR